MSNTHRLISCETGQPVLVMEVTDKVVEIDTSTVEAALAAMVEVQADITARQAAVLTSEVNALASANNASGSADNAQNSANNAAAAALNRTINAGSVSTAYNVDLAPADNTLLLVTLTGNTTLTINNAVAGKTLTMLVTQGGAGSFTLALPAACRTPGGTVIDWNTTPASVNLFNMICASATYIATTYVKL
ncbi:hypothetical protein [Fibrella aquatica]|uniref:hypothetical protein n=1 Tax=Fibrella aquatica TaxID=3242487 RepID=UPI00351FFE12